jgi:hypothetical protein
MSFDMKVIFKTDAALIERADAYARATHQGRA